MRSFIFSAMETQQNLFFSKFLSKELVDSTENVILALLLTAQKTYKYISHSTFRELSKTQFSDTLGVLVKLYHSQYFLSFQISLDIRKYRIN